MRELEGQDLEIQDIAADLDVSYKIAWRLVKTEIPHVRYGHKVRVSRADYDSWKASKRVDPRAERQAS